MVDVLGNIRAGFSTYPAEAKAAYGAASLLVNSIPEDRDVAQLASFLLKSAAGLAFISLIQKGCKAVNTRTLSLWTTAGAAMEFVAAHDILVVGSNLKKEAVDKNLTMNRVRTAGHLGTLNDAANGVKDAKGARETAKALARGTRRVVDGVSGEPDATARVTARGISKLIFKGTLAMGPITNALIQESAKE